MPAKVPFFLSEADEFVPEKYVGIFEIFTNPDYALPGYSKGEWCLGEKALYQMRVNTYRETRKRLVASGVTKFDRFWNGNLDALNAAGVNEFAKLACFSELSKVMMCFEYAGVTRNGHRRNYMSWGVRKDLYEKYRKSLAEAFEKGEMPKKVNLYDNKKRHANQVLIEPQATLRFETPDGSKRQVEIGKNELFLMFENWCVLKGKKRQQALYEAMELLMKQNPVEGLGKIESYERNIGLNRKEIVLDIGAKDREDIKITVPGSVANKAREIIKRYNEDIKNQAKPKLYMSAYAAQAIEAYNRRMPLKYYDPIAFQKYLEIQEAKKYNESIADKRGDDSERK